MPLLSQNCTAIFIATSTATEPLSQKKHGSVHPEEGHEPPRQIERGS